MEDIGRKTASIIERAVEDCVLVKFQIKEDVETYKEEKLKIHRSVLNGM